MRTALRRSAAPRCVTLSLALAFALLAACTSDDGAPDGSAPDVLPDTPAPVDSGADGGVPDGVVDAAPDAAPDAGPDAGEPRDAPQPGDVAADAGPDGGAVPGDLRLAWARQVRGSAGLETSVRGLAALPDGSVAATGTFCGSATFGPGEPNETRLDAVGNCDVFLARFGPDGALRWVVQAGGSGAASGLGVAVSGDALLVTGDFQGRALFCAGGPCETSLEAVAFWDVFVARYDSDGTLDWAVSAGGPGVDGGRSVAALSDGSAVVTGSFETEIVFAAGGPDETRLTTPGREGGFLARFGPDGGLRWARPFGAVAAAEADAAGLGLAALDDDSVAVTGRFGGTVAFGPLADAAGQRTASGDQDLFVARYDAAGALLRVDTAGAASAASVGEGVAALSDGSVVVVGQFQPAVTFAGAAGDITLETTLSAEEPELSRVFHDILLARFGADGEVAWAVGSGGPEWEYGSAIAALSDDSLVVTGRFRGAIGVGRGAPGGPLPLTAAGTSDVYVARFSAAGAPLWATSAGGDEIDQGLALAASPEGAVTVGGTFEGAATFGADGTPVHLTPLGFPDAFLSRWAPPAAR